MIAEIIVMEMSDRQKAIRPSDMRRLWIRPDLQIKTCKSTESNDAVHDADNSERL
jgi:hypothetical protein